MDSSSRLEGKINEESLEFDFGSEYIEVDEYRQQLTNLDTIFDNRCEGVKTLLGQAGRAHANPNLRPISLTVHDKRKKVEVSKPSLYGEIDDSSWVYTVSVK